MGPYRWAVIVGVLLIPTIFAVPRAVSQVAQKKNQDTQIEHGRYLVEDVAMCGECHTPRNARGELEMDKWLHGATIWIMPIHPDLNWAERVPPLAGLPSLTDEEAERVLENGTGPEGEVLRPPMHIYHMAPDDAKAVIAYLRSLPAGSE
jgi:hypothetical protein